MKLLLTSILFLALIGFLLPVSFACQQARNSRVILTETPPPADAKIVYGQDPNQFGELRLPKGDRFKKPYPVIVLLHGGCWMAEYGLGYMGHVAADLAAHGVATWNLEYRRVGNAGGGIKGTTSDIQSGMAQLKLMEQPHALDLRRVVVVGHSAGGHLALWLADRTHDQKFLRLYSGSSIFLRGVVSLAGITDLRRTGTACDANVPMLMGGVKEQVKNYEEYSPLALLPIGPVKQIIVQGEADKIIPSAMATSYVEAAQKKGDNARLVLLEKAGHFEIVDPQAAAWVQVRDEILQLVTSQ
jgi:acetyl esterase/lipase